jgi:hypothetical protein
MKRLAIATLLLASVLPLPAISSDAASVKQVDSSAWQPIARINPSQPYSVRLNNQTNFVVEYASTTNEFPPRTMQPRTAATLTKLPVPIYLLISAVDPEYKLQYKVSASKNVITINIQQLAGGGDGNTTVNIQETGGIYAY